MIPREAIWLAVMAGLRTAATVVLVSAALVCVLAVGWLARGAVGVCP